MRLLSYILLALGILTILVSGFYLVQINSDAVVEYDTSDEWAPYSEIVEGEKPLNVNIPSLSLNLPIYPAEKENDRWQTTTKGVSYLISSTKPGENGKGVYYAHNWQALFGRLSRIKPGELIYIKTQKENIYTYEVKTTERVTGSYQISSQNSEKAILLYTCAGLFDKDRLLVTAYQREDPSVALVSF